MYHQSISMILSMLCKGMTTPVVHRCPDGHYHHVIFDFASFIANYPEQVLLAGVVSNWCPKYIFLPLFGALILNFKLHCRCTALPKDLDGAGGHCTREFTDYLCNTLDSDRLWDEYGIDDDIVV